MSRTFQRSMVMALTVAIAAFMAALATGACSSEKSTPERVGSSSSAVSSVSVVDGGASGPHSVSSAVGTAPAAGGGSFVDQLTVWTGKSGSTYENFFGQRESGSALTVSAATGTWPAPATLADGNAFLNYYGPTKVAYLGESGKFVFASAASSQADGGGNTSVDVVLVTTTNGGVSFGAGSNSTATSVLCKFYGNGSGDAPACPGSSQDGVIVESIALAVDPNVSPYNSGSNAYHNVWLWFTTYNPTDDINVRDAYFYEFWVTSTGVVQQVAEGAGGVVSAVNTTWPSIESTVCTTPPGYCEANADTVTMVVGMEKSCINSNTPFLYAAWASYNPLSSTLSDTPCTPSQTTTNSTTWASAYILNQDTASYTVGSFSTNLIGSNTEPDCVGYQLNWPAPALAYDPLQGSVLMSLSMHGSNGQYIGTWTTAPLGCSGTGAGCTNCCSDTGDWHCGTSSSPYTTPQACILDGLVMDCTTSTCELAPTFCHPLGGANEVLPAIAYQDQNFLSVAWYDNRDGADGGANTPLTFGEVRAQSGAGDDPSYFLSTSHPIVPFSAEGTGTNVAPMNQSIGLAVQSDASAQWFGANNGDATIFNWQYSN